MIVVAISSTTTIRTYRYLFVFRFCLAVIHLRLNFELWNFSRPPLDLRAAPLLASFITSAVDVLPAAAPAIPLIFNFLYRITDVRIFFILFFYIGCTIQENFYAFFISYNRYKNILYIFLYRLYDIRIYCVLYKLYTEKKK
jgi:hypothetical protein